MKWGNNGTTKKQITKKYVYAEWALEESAAYISICFAGINPLCDGASLKRREQGYYIIIVHSTPAVAPVASGGPHQIWLDKIESTKAAAKSRIVPFKNNMLVKSFLKSGFLFLMK